MWYKARPMARRGLSATLLVILAVQLFGVLAFASVCPEPCPDDAQGTRCPPICALCTTCTHAQPALVQRSAAGAPLISTRHFVPQQRLSISSQLADDIFHVPLLG
jgi:hypothetical protein